MTAHQNRIDLGKKLFSVGRNSELRPFYTISMSII